MNGFTSVSFTTNTMAGGTTLRATTGSVTGQASITSVAGSPVKYIVVPATMNLVAGWRSA